MQRGYRLYCYVAGWRCHAASRTATQHCSRTSWQPERMFVVATEISVVILDSGVWQWIQPVGLPHRTLSLLSEQAPVHVTRRLDRHAELIKLFDSASTQPPHQRLSEFRASQRSHRQHTL